MTVRVEVLLPQWGMGMSEGTITNWFKSVGDSVSEDEPIAEVASEKVEEELLAPATGTITEIVVPAGETVEVRTLVAVIDDGD
ncbi:lipoyl domain-containing protein [Jatrophihabitans lederbergiae]|uniref:lipoyl domain-containing protein n=1 Tax=Jatrophihabitans lederbergiae TaxID=3075547 RepID=UPI0037BFFF67